MSLFIIYLSPCCKILQQVVTRVERVAVEIESKKAKQDLELARAENEDLKEEMTGLQAACDKYSTDLSEAKDQCLTLEQQVQVCLTAICL